MLSVEMIVARGERGNQADADLPIESERLDCRLDQSTCAPGKTVFDLSSSSPYCPSNSQARHGCSGFANQPYVQSPAVGVSLPALRNSAHLLAIFRIH
jgi:hypothetical protein